MYIPWSPSIQDVHNSSVEMSPLVNGSLSKGEKHFSAYAWWGSSLHPTFYLVGTCDRTMWECSNRALESCRELLVCTLVMYVCMYVIHTVHIHRSCVIVMPPPCMYILCISEAHFIPPSRRRNRHTYIRHHPPTIKPQTSPRRHNASLSPRGIPFETQHPAKRRHGPPIRLPTHLASI